MSFEKKFKFQIQEIQTYISLTKWIWMKRLSTIKFYKFPRYTTFILVICSSDKVGYVNFMNNITTTLSDEQMTKLRVIDLDEFYTFMFMNFSAEII
jgi:hypothetical protein